MHRTPPPGSFGLVRDPTPVGALIRFGQSLVGDHSRYNHAFLVLDRGEIIEAGPRGVRLNPVSKYQDRPGVIWAHLPHLTSAQQAAVVREGRAMLTYKYAWAVYLLIAVTKLGLPHRWLEAYVRGARRVICSVLIDLAYHRAGIRLFRDGRAPHTVTPGDLTNWLVEEAPHWRNPGGVSAL